MTAVFICLAVMLVLQLLTPFWWWVMIVPFAFGAAAARSGGRAFRTGFASAGMLWLGAGLYFYLTGSERIAVRMTRMIGLGKPWLLIAAGAVLAGLAGALSGWAGCAVRALFRKRNPRS
jgi:hypothetical protein